MFASSKGVAVLFNPSRDTDMSGEGLALGYLLTAMGANTPDSLAAVEAVFIHRHETYGQLDNLYVELVNLNSHVVEFFRFGGGEPVESVFAAGASHSVSSAISSRLTSLYARLSRHSDSCRHSARLCVRALLPDDPRYLRPHVSAAGPPCNVGAHAHKAKVSDIPPCLTALR